MIKVELKRWALTLLREQTWFGYTYVTFHIEPNKPVSKWYSNNSELVKGLQHIIIEDD